MTTHSGGWTYRFEVGGRQIEIPEGEVTVGRSRTCGVMLNDLSVSRAHAMLRVGPGRVTVKDLESSNGTYLNGIRLASEAEVADGDRLTIGETDVVVRITPPSGDGARPAAANGAANGGAFDGAVSTDIQVRCEGCGGALELSWRLCPACGRPTAHAGPAGAAAPGAPGTSPVRDPLVPAAAPVVSAPAPPLLPPLPPLPAAVPASAPSAAAPVAAAVVAPPALPNEMLQPLDDSMLKTPGPRGMNLPSPQSPAAEAGPLAPNPPPPARPGWGPAPGAAVSQAPVAGTPAGFWIRAVAVMIDWLLVAVPIVAVLFVLGFDSAAGMMIANGLAFVLGLGMPIVGWSRFGATPGKWLLGLRVLGPDGRPGLTLGRAALRVAGYMVNFGIGFVLVAFLPEKRGLHDLIAGTSVVRLKR